MAMKTLLQKDIHLTETAIDDFSVTLQQMLKSVGCKKEIILKTRLALEDALFQWLKRGFRKKIMHVELTKKFRHYIVSVTIAGAESNPFVDIDDMAGAELHNYLNIIVQQASYSYSNGINTITIRADGPGMNHLFWIISAIISAAFCGITIHHISPDTASYLSTAFVEPTFQTMLGMLTAIVAPSIFLSLISGIITLGTPKQLNKIAKQTLGIFMAALICVISFVAIASGFILSFTSVDNPNLANYAASVWKMFLDFIPTNMFMPFVEKDTMQILVLAIIFGIAILYMRESMDDVVSLILSLEKLLTSLLHVVCSCEPLLIFFGILNVTLEDFSGITTKIGIMLGAHLMMYFAVLLLAILFLVCIQKHHALAIVKKLLTPAFIGFATASSTAAFTSVVTTCTTKLGIQHKLVKFAVPLGQVLFKVGSSTKLFLLTLICLYFFNLPIHPFAIGILAISSFMLSMMIPPVSDGSVAAFTILFAYMELPSDALALAITSSVFIDFISTFMNVFCNQLFILMAALRLHMVDFQKLYK
jgi:Na+/H+-dicarboxylate symporter